MKIETLNKLNEALGNDTPRQQWEELKHELQSLPAQEIVSRIDAIDNETKWQEVEPDWWVEMMSARREYHQQLQK